MPGGCSRIGWGSSRGLSCSVCRRRSSRQDPAIAPVPIAARRRRQPAVPVTSFVDREHEFAVLRRLLEDHRLVTLTGPPGVGKSRLALEQVRSLETQLDEGRWLVELVRARGGVGVARILADALGARGPDPLAHVIARLRDGDAILIFDACEHALEEAAGVACALLRECPGVRVLATSRKALHVAGEVRVALGPLPVAGRARAPAAARRLCSCSPRGHARLGRDSS